MTVTLVLPTITISSAPKIREVTTEAKVLKFAQNDKFLRSGSSKKSFKYTSTLCPVKEIPVDRNPIESNLDTNNLRNRGFVKEDFCSERATLAPRQGHESRKKSGGSFSRNPDEKSQLARRDQTLGKSYIALPSLTSHKKTSLASEQPKEDLSKLVLLNIANNLK